MSGRRTEICSENLVLRTFKADDANSLSKLLNNQHISLMMGGGFVPYPYTQENAIAYIEKHKNDSLDTSAMALAITLKTTKEVIGNVQIRISENKNEGRLSYWIGTEYWGKGYATETVKCLLRFLFENSHLEAINADHFIGNPASGRVLEKCGFSKVLSNEVFNGTKDISHPKVSYRLTRKEYLTNSLNEVQEESDST